jgi:hypothetical protein
MGIDEATIASITNRGQARALIEQSKLGRTVVRRRGR